MLSEQPGKEISNNPKSEIDPDEPMVYQIRSNWATIGLKERIKGYHLRKLFKKGGQVFGFSMIALAKLVVVLMPGKFHRLLNKQFADDLKDFTACLGNN